MQVVKLDRVESRDRAPARREPYWHRAEAGCYLGFRKMTAGSAGSWIARYRDPETLVQTYHSLGKFEHHAPSERFDLAMAAARDWFKHRQHGGIAENITVRQACEQYVAGLQAEGKGETAADVESRFRRWVYEEKIAKHEVRKLTAHHLKSWRLKLMQTVVVANPHAEPDAQRTRKRSPSSVNRDMTALRAALNMARENGATTTNEPWRGALKAIENADGRRKTYLDRTQRGALIDKAPADLATFIRGLTLVPLRPGALAALRVSSFDKRLGVLTIEQDKEGAQRSIKLPEKTAAFFSEHCRNKLPTAPLLARADGKAWDKDSWKKPFKAAASAANLPATVTAYTMRHSVITDLVTEGLDALTVARLSGTSMQMIEKHYGHLRADHAAAALAKLAL